MTRRQPDMAEETALRTRGYRFVAGLDEVGRGALAGDVAAAAVVLPCNASIMERLRGVRDSKQLSASQRRQLYETIQAEAIAIGLGRVPAPVIDVIGIAPATRRAMAMAIAALGLLPDFLLIDAMRLPGIAIPQKGIIHGDASCLTIAAASIVAKVSRDADMIEQDALHPGYGFARHKGYATAFHRQAIQQLGPCPIHRRSFAPLRPPDTSEQ